MPPKPPGATVVAPATPEEAAALDEFLNWVADLIRYGRKGEERSTLAQKDCLTRTAPSQ